MKTDDMKDKSYWFQYYAVTDDLKSSVFLVDQERKANTRTNSVVHQYVTSQLLICFSHCYYESL